MRHRLLIILLMSVIGLSLGVVQHVAADSYGIDVTKDTVNEIKPGQTGAGTNLLPTTVAGESDIPSVIGKIVGVGLSLIGVVFFILALYAGFTWMTALGNTEKVTKAKDILEAAIIGLVIVFAAYAISSFVFSAIQGQQPAGAPTTGGAAGGGRPPVEGKDAPQIPDCTQPDAQTTQGKHCGDNSYCDNGQCVPQCQYEYGATGNGSCVDQNSCTDTVEPGKCPGTSVCCVKK